MIKYNRLIFVGLIFVVGPVRGQIDKSKVDAQVVRQFSQTEILKLEQKVGAGFELQSVTAKNYIDQGLTVLQQLPSQINAKKASLPSSQSSCQQETDPDQKIIKCDQYAKSILELSILVDYYESILQTVIAFHGVVCTALTTSTHLNFKNYCQPAFYQNRNTWNDTFIGTNKVLLNDIKSKIQQLHTQLGWQKTVTANPNLTVISISGEKVNLDASQIQVTVLSGGHTWSQAVTSTASSVASTSASTLKSTSTSTSTVVVATTAAVAASAGLSTPSVSGLVVRNVASVPDHVIRNGELIGVKSANLFDSHSRQYVKMKQAGTILLDP